MLADSVHRHNHFGGLAGAVNDRFQRLSPQR